MSGVAQCGRFDELMDIACVSDNVLAVTHPEYCIYADNIQTTGQYDPTSGLRLNVLKMVQQVVEFLTIPKLVQTVQNEARGFPGRNIWPLCSPFDDRDQRIGNLSCGRTAVRVPLSHVAYDVIMPTVHKIRKLLY